MIPLRLQLRNFMCYTDVHEPLQFEGIHVACLTGDNGHGKSALLDAITWALWGECRARFGGARVVIVNAQPTNFDDLADAVLRGSISEVLPAITSGNR